MRERRASDRQRPLRLVVLIESYLPTLGGAQNNVHELCSRLVRRGHECEVLTRRYARAHPSTEERDGLTIRRFGFFPIRPIAKIAWAARVFFHLLEHRKRYDLVLSVPIFYWADLLPAYLNRLVTGKPFLVRTTMAGNFDAMLSWRVDSPSALVKKVLFPPFLWRRVLSKAEALVAQSKLLLERARAFDLPRVQLISNGVDTERFAVADLDEKRELRSELGLPLEHAIVICTGRFVAEKNQIVLLQAVEKLVHARLSPPVLLLLLGIEEYNSAVATEGMLRRFVRDHGLERNVGILRDVDSVERYLRASDIFVLPTTFDEGVSNSVLEAMSCGLPVVCSSLPQLQAMFPKGEGIFFEPGDSDTLHTHLQALLQLNDRGSSKGTSLAEFIRSTQPIGRTVDAYEVLLSRSHRATPSSI